MSENQVFWLISAPNLQGADIFDLVNQKTAKENSLSENRKFNTPSLRVGTLNSLITLNDELQKIDTLVEATTKKIAKQLVDLVGTKPGKDKSLSINGATIPQYLQQFVWDDAKYNLKLSLQEIVDKISQSVSKIDDDLKLKSSEYSSLSSSVAAEERKAGGSLQVRSLNGLITQDNIVQTDYLTTAFVAVPITAEKDFLACYETLSDYVLARSAKKVAQDNEFYLYSVFLFKKFYENFKNKIGEKKWVVRDFKVESEKPTQERAKLTEEKKNYRTGLIRWCRLNFPEAFMAWIHLKVVRVFVESVLRFGIPFDFQAILMQPLKREDKKLRDILFEQFKYLGSAHISGKNEADDSEKFYPYVYIPINWEQ
ncbi:H(+)-transporting ATPase [Dictyostelium purpureum]|uniref:V-type proton ATPase subunit C n=1 Tax=Dictyostelium purpureum TaxID=5786 RepID=F0ZSW5_DICPU|nr:H(+)-transporting ATPase [Dictyostelium purpureum]EGC32948.1 H(+)-transporting ATPase [Dictyostelium purpureum]|eukprot:XP_003290514.1 H(+)-transporting ATPase [Dictyostelium purpureum]